MIRTANSIAVRFETFGKTLETLIFSQLESNQGKQVAILQKVSDQFGKHADVINQQGKQLSALYQLKQFLIISLVYLIQCRKLFSLLVDYIGMLAELVTYFL